MMWVAPARGRRAFRALHSARRPPHRRRLLKDGNDQPDDRQDRAFAGIARSPEGLACLTPVFHQIPEINHAALARMTVSLAVDMLNNPLTHGRQLRGPGKQVHVSELVLAFFIIGPVFEGDVAHLYQGFSYRRRHARCRATATRSLSTSSLRFSAPASRSGLAEREVKSRSSTYCCRVHRVCVELCDRADDPWQLCRGAARHDVKKRAQL